MSLVNKKTDAADDSAPFRLVGKLGLREVALGALVLQNCTLVLCMWMSRNSGGEPYSAPVAVIMTEVFKLFAAIAAIVLVDGKRVQDVPDILYRAFFVDTRDMLLLCVPGLLYAAQNNLLYASMSYIDAGTMQVLYQLKVLTTAVCSVFILNRQLSTRQWLALMGLTVGAGIVQYAQSSGKDNGGSTNSNMFLGSVCVLAATLTSGFAGVFLEKKLKGKGSLWVRNVQLAVIGIVSVSLGLAWSDGANTLASGPFTGFTPLVWLVVFIGSVGGILVAVVVKYADNIAKAFATTVSVVVSISLSWVVFGITVGPLFLLGCSFVLLATFVYSTAPKKPQPGAEKGTPGLSGIAAPSVPELSRLPPPPDGMTPRVPSAGHQLGTGFDV